MATKKQVSMTISPDVWEELGKLADEFGTTRSGIIEMMTRYMIMAETAPFGEVIGKVVQETLEILKTGQGPGRRRP